MPHNLDNRVVINNPKALNKEVDTIILDLDDTMYRFETGVFYAMNGACAKFISENLDMSIEKAMEFQNSQYVNYGTNTAGLIKTKRDVSLTSFLIAMHNVNLSVIKPDPHLNKNLTRMKDEGKQIYIFSNALNQPYIPKVLDKLQIDQGLFDGVAGAEDVNYISKPNEEAFTQFFNKFEIKPERALFIEDSQKNLKTAKEFGMTTMLLLYPDSKHSTLFPKSDKIVNASNEQLKLICAEMPYVDFASLNINAGLNKIFPSCQMSVSNQKSGNNLNERINSLGRERIQKTR